MEYSELTDGGLVREKMTAQEFAGTTGLVLSTSYRNGILEQSFNKEASVAPDQTPDYNM